MKVAISRCSSYEEEKLEKALDEALDFLGGLENFISPGMKVLLKVNLLTAKSPEKAVTTHPEFVKILCRKIKRLGAVPWVGDSSGGILPNQNPTARSLEVSGIEAMALEEGVRVVNFDRFGAMKVDNPDNSIFPHVYLAKPIFEADLVISLPKFKTHGLTVFTGGVKNMFGAVPGSLKRDYHSRAPRMKDFARILADIYHLTSPSLTIMDGILAMEEDGPSGGSPRELGLILASTDGVSLDEAAVEIAGLSPGEIPTSKIAGELGYGISDRDKIHVPGKLNDWKVMNFQPPKNPMVFANYMPGFIVGPLMNQLKTLPDVNEAKCTSCRICVDSCPVEAVYINEKAKINWNACIECLCCHELCPQKAIKLTPKGILSKLAFGFMNLKRTFFS